MSIILVHSPKGGVGTTTVAANLALSFARRGADVGAIDLTGQDSLALHFGSRPDVAGNANVRTDDEVAVIAGVHLLSVGRRRLSDSDAGLVVARAHRSDALLIVDIAAGDYDTLDELLPHALVHIGVMTPDPAALALLPLMLDRAHSQATRFVINQVDDRFRLRRDAAGFLRSIFDEALIGTIRRDEAVNEALAMIEPLPVHQPASSAVADIDALAVTIGSLLPAPVQSSESWGAA